MGLSTVYSWLDWIASQQPAEMLLGLDRVKVVAERLSLLHLKCPVVTVGGTNGKGSTVAGLDSIYRAAGYRVGTFTSPILFKHNEYVRLNGKEVSDAFFCLAYQHIADAKQEIGLTPFEFHTLAALWMFKNVGMDPRLRGDDREGVDDREGGGKREGGDDKPLDIIILEVGLGGRLDAVNIIDADVAIVTSIDIDHADCLGDTREKIAYEKAGIFRQEKFAICGDRNPPNTLIEQAVKIGAKLFNIGNNFDYKENDGGWNFTTTQDNNMALNNLPLNSFYLQNMACVLMAIKLLENKLPVRREEIDEGLINVSLFGRVQIINGDVTEIYDVSHNPAAIAYLAKRLSAMPCKGNTIAVFSMLADKDITKSVKQISSVIDEWHIAPLDVKRAASIDQLNEALTETQVNIFSYDKINKAYINAKERAKVGDRIVIFGSFHTVAAILKND